ncbi:MAG: hypothetical protein U0075_05960 [Thermomicrobiales bacterium]
MSTRCAPPSRAALSSFGLPLIAAGQATTQAMGFVLHKLPSSGSARGSVLAVNDAGIVAGTRLGATTPPNAVPWVDGHPGALLSFGAGNTEARAISHDSVTGGEAANATVRWRPVPSGVGLCTTAGRLGLGG